MDPEESKSGILNSNSFNNPFVILFISESMWRGVDPERSGSGSGGDFYCFPLVFIVKVILGIFLKPPPEANPHGTANNKKGPKLHGDGFPCI